MELAYDKLYNSEVKKRYLEQIDNEGSRTTVYFQLLNASRMERRLGKDLYDMSLKEIELVLYDIAGSTLTSVTNHLFCYNKYITWAIQEGLPEAVSNFTVLDGKNFHEYGKKFVATYKTNIFSREQVLRMTYELVNYVDRALLLALFEGIKGEGFSEILNLRSKDLKEKDGKFFAYLRDVNGTERTLEISEELYDTLLKADKQDIYINSNGNAESSRVAISYFVESDRIFKKSLRGKQTTDNLLDKMFINRKFLMFKKIFERRHLKPSDLEKSGMCQMAYDLYQQKGEKPLSTEDYRKIGDRYNTPMNRTPDGEQYRNVTAIKKVICTPNFIETFGVKVW